MFAGPSATEHPSPFGMLGVSGLSFLAVINTSSMLIGSDLDQTPSLSIRMISMVACG